MTSSDVFRRQKKLVGLFVNIDKREKQKLLQKIHCIEAIAMKPFQ